MALEISPAAPTEAVVPAKNCVKVEELFCARVSFGGRYVCQWVEKREVCYP
ncbi:MAG: hypothetical protein ACREE7_00115 [Dongiaceae bacterium]